MNYGRKKVQFSFHVLEITRSTHFMYTFKLEANSSEALKMSHWVSYKACGMAVANLQPVFIEASILNTHFFL